MDDLICRDVRKLLIHGPSSRARDCPAVVPKHREHIVRGSYDTVVHVGVVGVLVLATDLFGAQEHDTRRPRTLPCRLRQEPHERFAIAIGPLAPLLEAEAATVRTQEAMELIRHILGELFIFCGHFVAVIERANLQLQTSPEDVILVECQRPLHVRMPLRQHPNDFEVFAPLDRRVDRGQSCR